MTLDVNIGSFARGILAMKPLHKRKRALYGFRITKPKKPWLILWTPIWHEGRGPYISVGLVVIAFCRGY